MKAVWISVVVVVILIIAGFFFWSGLSDTESEPVTNLPWQIKTDEAGYTEVFGIQPGRTTVREMINEVRHFPEIALFTNDKVAPRLEAYFGKRRLGVLEARLLAEIDADEALLQQFIDASLERKAQPSGAWKYTLNEADIKKINELFVRFLIYMPVADYDEGLIRQHFGSAQEIIAINAQAAYWFYPDKGLAIFLNYEGGEILHYSSLQDFAALRQRLIKEATYREQHG